VSYCILLLYEGRVGEVFDEAFKTKNNLNIGLNASIPSLQQLYLCFVPYKFTARRLTLNHDKRQGMICLYTCQVTSTILLKDEQEGKAIDKRRNVKYRQRYYHSKLFPDARG